MVPAQQGQGLQGPDPVALLQENPGPQVQVLSAGGVIDQGLRHQGRGLGGRRGGEVCLDQGVPHRRLLRQGAPHALELRRRRGRPVLGQVQGGQTLPGRVEGLVDPQTLAVLTFGRAGTPAQLRRAPQQVRRQNRPGILGAGRLKSLLEGPYGGGRSCGGRVGRGCGRLFQVNQVQGRHDAVEEAHLPQVSPGRAPGPSGPSAGRGLCPGGLTGLLGWDPIRRRRQCAGSVVQNRPVPVLEGLPVGLLGRKGDGSLEFGVQQPKEPSGQGRRLGRHGRRQTLSFQRRAGAFQSRRRGEGKQIPGLTHDANRLFGAQQLCTSLSRRAGTPAQGQHSGEKQTCGGPQRRRGPCGPGAERSPPEYGKAFHGAVPLAAVAAASAF